MIIDQNIHPAMKQLRVKFKQLLAADSRELQVHQSTHIEEKQGR
jgi:hypothetical protein